MKTSVIIPTLNREESLIETLLSFENSEILPEEIIIVDQSDLDNSKKILEKIKKLNINYIHYPFPSLTKARNIGISRATNEILVFSDDDIEIQKDTFKNIKKIFEENKFISLIGGYDLNSKKEIMNPKKILSSLIGRRSFFKIKKGHMSSSILGNFPIREKNEKYGYQIETEWAMGFFFACKKSLVEKWELKFDENLISYAYAEDLDFTHRYYLKGQILGYKMIFSNLVEVYHKVSQEYRIPKFKHTLMYVIHRKYLFYKFKKNIFELLIFEWSDFCFLIRKVLQKEAVYDFFKTKLVEIKYKEELKKGEISKELKSMMK